MSRMAFVLGAPRSGTTLLSVMLAGHPELFSPPEMVLAPFATMAERTELLEHLVAFALGRAFLGIRIRRLVEIVLDFVESFLKLGQPAAKFLLVIIQIGSPGIFN